MIEYLGYDLLQSHWPSFSQVLAKYTKERSCVLRQAACYGLGILAQQTPTTVVSAGTVRIWLEALCSAVKEPKGPEEEISYYCCRENGVAAIGKIIKTHSSVFNPRMAISFWIHFLPLRYDKEEGMIQI